MLPRLGWEPVQFKNLGNHTTVGTPEPKQAFSTIESRALEHGAILVDTSTGETHIMMHRFIYRLPLVNPIRSTVIAAAVASLSLLAGAGAQLPTAAGSATLGAAWAQDSSVSQEEVIGYATSVLEMDAPRNEALGQIRTLLTGTGQDLSSIDMSCTSTASLSQLPRNLRSSVRTVVVNYCNQAGDIVEANGLTVRQFNAITAAYPQDPSLTDQIRAAMIDLQQQSATGGTQ
ncbi:MAG: DUF4168 domain-containing protein [Nodosilinea sp.]